MNELAGRARSVGGWEVSIVLPGSQQASLRVGAAARVQALGKSFRLGDEGLRVRGVTYGSFRTRSDGAQFPEPDRLLADLRAMRDAGLNTLRTYTTPPTDLLDTADELGMFVIAGVYYDDWRMTAGPGRRATRQVRDAGLRAVDEMLERCAGRRNVLGLSVGNEVPADLVRLHGRGRVADTLSELVTAVHDGDPDMLVTYTNFPTTEYLEVEGQDFCTFNVFLERPVDLRRYLRHLNRLAGERPLVITELGLAERLHGRAQQAASLDWQLDLVDETGCAGATVFAWTDEWAVADKPVEGWGFGITDENRHPKASFDVVGRWARRDLHDLRGTWPRVSVVVCAYNEGARIRECMESLAKLDYQDLEVIVCDDGSTDDTLAIMREYPFRVLDLPHGGLSNARNAGIQAATGEIVAFLDADASCTPDWLYHLVLSFDDDNVVATGGPNLPVPDAPLVERAVAMSPGAPVEVLIADDRAEHVPGCNMAYRRDALLAVDGFNPAYTAAGDDVDVCWKLLDRGHEIAFAPSAEVFHHRRDRVRGYLRQQKGYGRAEKMLTGPHPHRFNRFGQARWNGVIYGGVQLLPRLLRPVVYHGYLGAAPFQKAGPARGSAPLAWLGVLLPLTVVPAVFGLAFVAVSPWAALATAASVLTLLGYGVVVAASVRPDRHEPRPWALRGLVAFMHVAQPFVRVWGRLRGRPVPAPAEATEPWTGDRYAWLDDVRVRLAASGCSVRVGTPASSYDVAAFVGPFAELRLTTAVLWRWTPVVNRVPRPRVSGVLLLAAAAVLALTVPWGWVALVATAAAAATELTMLHRRFGGALRDSVDGAVTNGETR